MDNGQVTQHGRFGHRLHHVVAQVQARRGGRRRLSFPDRGHPCSAAPDDGTGDGPQPERQPERRHVERGAHCRAACRAGHAGDAGPGQQRRVLHHEPFLELLVQRADSHFADAIQSQQTGRRLRIRLPQPFYYGCSGFNGATLLRVPIAAPDQTDQRMRRPAQVLDLPRRDMQMPRDHHHRFAQVAVIALVPRSHHAGVAGRLVVRQAATDRIEQDPLLGPAAGEPFKFEHDRRRATAAGFGLVTRQPLPGGEIAGAGVEQHQHRLAQPLQQRRASCNVRRAADDMQDDVGLVARPNQHRRGGCRCSCGGAKHGVEQAGPGAALRPLRQLRSGIGRVRQIEQPQFFAARRLEQQVRLPLAQADAGQCRVGPVQQDSQQRRPVLAPVRVQRKLHPHRAEHSHQPLKIAVGQIEAETARQADLAPERPRRKQQPWQHHHQRQQRGIQKNPAPPDQVFDVGGQRRNRSRRAQASHFFQRERSRRKNRGHRREHDTEHAMDIRRRKKCAFPLHAVTGPDAADEQRQRHAERPGRRRQMQHPGQPLAMQVGSERMPAQQKNRRHLARQVARSSRPVQPSRQRLAQRLETRRAPVTAPGLHPTAKQDQVHHQVPDQQQQQRLGQQVDLVRVGHLVGQDSEDQSHQRDQGRRPSFRHARLLKRDQTAVTRGGGLQQQRGAGLKKPAKRRRIHRLAAHPRRICGTAFDPFPLGGIDQLAAAVGLVDGLSQHDPARRHQVQAQLVLAPLHRDIIPRPAPAAFGLRFPPGLTARPRWMVGIGSPCPGILPTCLGGCARPTARWPGPARCFSMTGQSC